MLKVRKTHLSTAMAPRAREQPADVLGQPSVIILPCVIRNADLSSQGLYYLRYGIDGALDVRDEARWLGAQGPTAWTASACSKGRIGNGRWWWLDGDSFTARELKED